MPARKRKSEPEIDVSFRVDPAALDEMEQLIGQPVARVTVWEESIADAFGDAEFTDATADMDVYLADGVRFELFAVLCYESLDSEPLRDLSDLGVRFAELVMAGLYLDDVAVDTEDDLVLVLSAGDSTLFLNTGAWTLDEWEELPD